MNKLLIIISMIFCFTSALAEDPTPSQLRPITSAYSLEWGYSSVLDTYISPLKYSGQAIAISGQWSKAMRQNPNHLMMTFDANLSADIDKSPAHNSFLYGLNFNFAWNMQYKWKPIPKLHLSAGGGFALNTGAYYLQRNSNNPISAKASIDLTLNATAAYSLKIGKLPIRLIDQLSTPLAGIFFSPGYGQTYYEIYLGNHSGLVHCGWWGNHFQINNLIAADLNLGNINLRLGYRLNLLSSYANNLNTQTFRHSLVIGIVSDWLNITDNTYSQQTIIPAYF